MGLRTGGRRAKGLKNRVKSSKIELRFREVRSEGCTSCTPVQQALIYPVSQTWQFCFGRTAFLLLFFLLNWEARRPERQAGPCASPVPPTTKNPQTKWPGDHGGAFSTAGAIYRVKRIDFTHLRVIARFCDFIPHLFQHPAGGFGIKSRKIPGDIVQVLHGKGQIFDFIRHTVYGASPIHFRGLPTACWGQPPAVLPW